MKKTTFIILTLLFYCSIAYAQQDMTGAPSIAGATKFLVAGHTTVTAVMDSGQNNISDANFSAIFLYQLSEKLFVESEIEIETGDGAADLGLEHANLVWMLGRNIAFHAGRFVPHFGLYRGRLGEGFINRFATDPVGFGDGGIGTMEAVGFGFQGGFPLGVSKMNYDLWVSNGPKLFTGLNDDGENAAGQFDYETYGDNNKNKATGGRIGFLPFSNSCLELGVSYESAMKTGDQYTDAEKVGVRMMAIDANFYHKVDFIQSTLRITGEYKTQDVDKFDYPLLGSDGAQVLDSAGTGLTYTFKNSSNAYYASVSLRPTGVDNNVLRNFEIAFRTSQFTTPDGAPWANYDPDTGKNIKVQRNVFALDYWLKWNCVLKACYQTETNNPGRFFIQMYYGF